MLSMKLKTHKGTAKRIKVTKSGKLIHSKAGRSHLRVRKWNNLDKLSFGKEIHKSEYRKLKALLPYSA